MQFNGTAATVTAASATQLTVTVPAGATTGPIAVTSPAGTATSALPFTVTADSGAPTITSFTPTIGAPGTAVSITGTNVDPLPVQNSLAFNGKATPVTAATATTLTATVQPGSTSGRLTLATPGGLVTSENDFFVPPLDYTAADVSQTGRLEINGPSLTRSIAPNTVGVFVFDGGQGEQVSLAISGLQFYSSGLTIFRPDGVQLVAIGVPSWGATIQIESLPQSGTYTVLVDPSGGLSGSMTLTLSQDLDGGVFVVDGPSKSLTIARPGQRATGTFEGTAGSQLIFYFTSQTFSNATVTVFEPDGSTPFTQAGVPLWDGTVEFPVLPLSGTYTIRIEPDGGATVNLTAQLSQEISQPIAIDGAAVPLSLSKWGQRAKVTFTGTAGQRLSMGVSGLTIQQSDVSLRAPDGSSLIGPTFINSDRGIDFPVLPTTGTYSFYLDPRSNLTGDATLTLSSAVAGSITAGGGAATVTVPRAGQLARLTFTGTAGQRVSLLGTGTTFGAVSVSLENPDGSSGGGFFTAYQQPPNPNGWGEPKTLPATGTYTLLVNPEAVYTGSITLTLYDVPPDVTGTLTIGGPVQHLDLLVPGQNASYTFAAPGGQPFTVRGDNSTMSCTSVTLQSPGGGLNINPCGSWTLSQTPSATTTYTVIIDPNGPNTGSVDLSITTP